MWTFYGDFSIEVERVAQEDGPDLLEAYVVDENGHTVDVVELGLEEKITLYRSPDGQVTIYA